MTSFWKDLAGRLQRAREEAKPPASPSPAEPGELRRPAIWPPRSMDDVPDGQYDLFAQAACLIGEAAQTALKLRLRHALHGGRARAGDGAARIDHGHLAFLLSLARLLTIDEVLAADPFVVIVRRDHDFGKHMPMDLVKRRLQNLVSSGWIIDRTPAQAPGAALAWIGCDLEPTARRLGVSVPAMFDGDAPPERVAEAWSRALELRRFVLPGSALDAPSKTLWPSA